MERYIMAIDAGTSSARCILFDRAGAPCALAQRELHVSYPQEGWVEQDANELWTVQREVCRQAMARLGVGAEELAENRQIHEWLAAGVEIEYDKAEAVDEIDGTSFKSELERQGAGTIIILKVTVPACTGDTAFGKDRIIVLYRDTTQSDWYVKTEGVR